MWLVRRQKIWRKEQKRDRIKIVTETIKRNRDFKYLTNDAGNGKNRLLRSEVGKESREITARDEIV